MDISKLKELKDGSGNFGKCYIVDDDTLYKKFFLGSDKKYIFYEEHFKYTSNIDNDTFIFPQELDTENGIVFGYTVKYIHAKRLDKIGYNFSTEDFIFALQKLKEDLKDINDRHLLIADANAKNTLYNGKLYMIDTDFYIKDKSNDFNYDINEEGICLYLYDYLIDSNIGIELQKLIYDHINLEEIYNYFINNYKLEYLIELLYELKEVVYKLEHKDVDNFKKISKVLKRCV